MESSKTGQPLISSCRLNLEPGSLFNLGPSTDTQASLNLTLRCHFKPSSPLTRDIAIAYTWHWPGKEYRCGPLSPLSPWPHHAAPAPSCHCHPRSQSRRPSPLPSLLSSSPVSGLSNFTFSLLPLAAFSSDSHTSSAVQTPGS